MTVYIGSETLNLNMSQGEEQSGKQPDSEAGDGPSIEIMFFCYYSLHRLDPEPTRK